MADPQELIGDFQTLSTAEERLEWIVERQTNHPCLTPDELRDELLVPECISRLWFLAERQEERCVFRVRSDSKVVQAVAAFICDLYSDRTPAEIIDMGANGLRALKLEELLSFNRRRTIERLWTMIHHAAAN